MIVAYIDSHRERFGVEPVCAELSQHGITIAPSTYHAHKACPVSPAALEEAYLANALVTLHAARTGACTGPGSCGAPLAGRAWTSAGTRSPG